MHLQGDDQIYLLSQENNRLQETVYLLEQKLRIIENEYSNRKIDVDRQIEALKIENNQLTILKGQQEIQLDNLLNSYNILSKKNQELELSSIKSLEIRNQFDFLKQEIEKEQKVSQRYKEIAQKKKHLLSTLNIELIQLKKSLDNENLQNDLEFQNQQLRSNNQEMINTIQSLQTKFQLEKEKIESDREVIRDQLTQISDQTRQLQMENKLLADQISQYQTMEKELQILVEWSESRQNKAFGPFKSVLVKKISTLIARLIGIIIELQNQYEENQQSYSQLQEINQQYLQQIQKFNEEKNYYEHTIIAIQTQMEQYVKANNPEQVSLLLQQKVNLQYQQLEKDIQTYREIQKNEFNQILNDRDTKILQLQQHIQNLDGHISTLQQKINEEHEENIQLQINQANYLRLLSKPSQDSNRRSSYSCDNTEGMLLKQFRKVKEIENEVNAINELVNQLF